MTQLLIRGTAPTSADTPDALIATGYAAVIATRHAVELRLQIALSAAAPVSVRPWYLRGGTWQPLRTDGAVGVGTEPVTADKTRFGGFASGIYLSGPMATVFCLVQEAGADPPTAIVSADLSEYFFTT